MGWDSGTQRRLGTGLSVFDSNGLLRLHLFGARAVYDAQVVGARAFVRASGTDGRYSILDLRTGRQVRTIRDGEMPLVLSGEGGAFFG